MSMPEIKPVVNKEPEKDKKKGGLLARLFGGGGSGGGAGLGGFGGAGGGGGLAAGGILATKAGVLALVLVGTTVAGGIGMVGYRLFGPGAEMTGNGDNLQLFASKPKDAASADGQGGAAKGDGTSASLQYLSQANTAPKPADAAAAEAPKDATAAGATGADAAASAAGGASGPLNASGSAGNGVSHAMLHNTAKFGQLSGPTGGGGSGAVASAAPKGGAAFDPSAATKGSISGFRKGANAISGATGRSVAGRHFGSARQQALGVLSNQRGAQSSYAAGQTYDGAGAGSNIGANGTPIGGPGAGSGGAAQPKTLPGPSTDQNNSQQIPTPPATAQAPWAGLLQTAEILIGIAAACLMACYMLNKPPMSTTTLWIVRILGAIAAAIGAIIIGIGATIAHKWGQKQFGLIGLGVGGLLIALGINSMFASNPPSATEVAAKGGEAAATNTANGVKAAEAANPGSAAAGDYAGLPKGVVPFVDP